MDNKEDKKMDKKTYDKIYRDKNKQMLNDKRKKYANENKDKINNYNHKYYQQNKESLMEKIECSCGSEVCSKNMTRHLKSKLHLAYQKGLTEE